jgi:hypothetical protein
MHVRLMVPATRADRRRGLLGRDGLGDDEALLLRRCRSVHTFGMRFTIDVVLLDAAMRPLRVITMRSGRLLLPRPRVRHILETAEGRGQAAAAAVRSLATTR